MQVFAGWSISSVSNGKWYYLNHFQKKVWLDFYFSAYKARVSNFGAVSVLNDNNDTDDNDSTDNTAFSFITSYSLLQEKYSCSKSLLSKTFSNL